MKIKNLLTVATLTALLTAAGCNEDDPSSKDPIDQLPPPTQEGKNTFGCLVNGEAWVIKSTIRATAVYQGGFLQMGANIDAGGRDQSISLSIDGNVNKDFKYIITKDISQNASAAFTNSTTDCDYDYENVLSGEIFISKFTIESPFIVSGTFEFTTALNDCDTIRVTDGRFDLNYIP